MDTSGKLLILLGLTFVLFAGCIGGESQDYVTEGETTPIGEAETPVTQPGIIEDVVGCTVTHDYTPLPEEVTMGEVLTFSVTSTCSKGRIVGLNIDDQQESGGMITTNDPITYNFILAPETEGTKSITLWSDDDVVYQTTVEVKPIGSIDTSGNKNDAASVKEWLATSFEIETPIQVNSVGAYMKRLYSQTMEHSMAVAQIRADNDGIPANEKIAEAVIPITGTTLSENWIYFNYPETVELQPGKYWVVFTVTQETQDQIISDVVNVHYTFGGDTTVPGNDYTRKMTLEWDNNKRKFVETSWKPLAYERTYSVIVSSAKH